MYLNKRYLIWLVIFTMACQGKPEQDEDTFKMFDLLSEKETGIDFTNTVENKDKFNIFSYRNFYNGGGVAIGDVNNDGLSDVFLTSNEGPNKLYLNKGNMKFEDISAKAGIEGTKTWSTGVAMVDINQDGLLDIYVCNAGYSEEGNLENELFINNGNLTFSEKAADYGLDDNGLTTHAAFFDYDLDGDLDAYILNNSFIPVNTLNYQNKRNLYAEDWDVKDFVKGGGDKLLRNDNGKFTDVSKQAGIYGSLIGFGLGITVGDVNEDQLPDIYISNDFFERDYLYVNQGDGTFKEEIEDRMGHISLASMGADMADINNDGHPEIFVTEMLPETDEQIKSKSLFDSYNTYNLKLKRDFYHQFMQNTLQLNNEDGSFSEVAWLSGVAASDWSWGALMFDADNDGYRDIYVCNGVFQDVTDQDFIDFFANDVVQSMVLTGVKEKMENVLARMPSNPQPNKFFYNNKNLTFTSKEELVGLGKPSFSNGAAYGDLDNDGDLDLVVNNLEQKSFVFRNNSEKLNHHYLKLKIEGEKPNTFGVGTKVYLYSQEGVQHAHLIPNRGFQSSVDLPIIFGLGNNALIDSLVFIWPNRTKSIIPNPPSDTTLLINYSRLVKTEMNRSPKNNRENQLFTQVNHRIERHAEDEQVDFYNEGLIIKMLSKEGPKMDKGDLNGDGLEDLVVAGANKQPTKIYFQKSGGFSLNTSLALENSEFYEDTAIELFDADGDGDLDLFVGSGGNHVQEADPRMEDRLYINNGKGGFSQQKGAFPEGLVNTAVALTLDYDEDGDLDLFIGSRSTPIKYGVSPRSYLYENDGSGNFTDITVRRAAELKDLGMVTDAILSDINGDGKKELIVTGEWMATKIFKIEGKQLTSVETNLSQYPGWWYSLKSIDVDNDGDMDLVMGNRGENFYFTANADEPAKLWVSDFDNNGTTEKIMTRTINGRDMPLTLKKELTDQLPLLKKQNLQHVEYANKSIQDLFSAEAISKAEVKTATYFKTAIAINNGNNQFTLQALPNQVQISNVQAIHAGDLNEDGLPDLVLGGNFTGFTPQYSRLDASYGQVLINQGNGNFQLLPSTESGIKIKGDVKQILPIEIDGDLHLLFAINDKEPVLLKKKNLILKNE